MQPLHRICPVFQPSGLTHRDQAKIFGRKKDQENAIIEEGGGLERWEGTILRQYSIANDSPVGMDICQELISAPTFRLFAAKVGLII
jgi:hypothetical protein